MRAFAHSVILALALVSPAIAQAPKQTPEQSAVVLGASYLFVPTYCPGWSSDLDRLAEALTRLGYTQVQLGQPPLREKVDAVVELFSEGDHQEICKLIMKSMGPFGLRIFTPR